MQIFKKHAKLTYLFIWKTMLQSVILLWKCAFRPGMSVFVMVCETRPLPVYPIVFRHPGLPVGGKHSVFNIIHSHVRSFLLVSLNWQPACASCDCASLRRRGWWKKTSPIFWIWTAIPSSTAMSILHTAPLTVPCWIKIYSSWKNLTDQKLLNIFNLHDAPAKPTVSWRTPPIPPTVFSSSYHQEDGSGASEPAPPDCSTAFSPRLWEPWTQITPPPSETPYKPPTSWNMD